MTDAVDIAWPVKTREMHNHHMNSTVWNSFKFRPDDIVVATWGKSGTTWTQQIVGQLVFNGAEGIDVAKFRPGSIFASCRRRRSPASSTSPTGVSSRPTFRSTRWFSRRRRNISISAATAATRSGACTTTTPTPTSCGTMRSTTRPASSAIRSKGRRLAARIFPAMAREGRLSVLAVLGKHPLLVGGPRPPERQAHSLQHNEERPCRLDSRDRGVPRHPDRRNEVPGDRRPLHVRLHEVSRGTRAPAGGIVFEGGGKTFFDKGTNGRWRDTLTAEDIKAYEAKALAELGPECARWLAQGA